MEDTINACRTIFGTTFCVARSILPMLRPFDVRGAAARLVKDRIPEGIDLRAEENKSHLNALVRIARARRTLLAYVNQRERDRVWAGAQLPTDGAGQTYYGGSMVPTSLRFGAYLYYRGAVSREMLAEALEWQKRKRPLLGQIAMSWGLLSPSQFALLLCLAGKGSMLGRTAIKHGLLTHARVEHIVVIQGRYNARIGRYFVEKGILSAGEVDGYYHEMCAHNLRHAA